MTLIFEPLLPAAAWLLLALATAGALAWYAWHRPPGFPLPRWRLIQGLCFAAASVVLWVLLNPTWLEPIPPPAGKPVLTVLVDTSGSMATADASGSRTRLSLAVEQARSLTRGLSASFDLQWRQFADRPAPITPEELPQLPAKGSATDLATAIAASLADDRPQGQALLLVSDGAHNGTGGSAPVLEAVKSAKALGAPIYSMTVGTSREPDDLEVTASRPQELAFLGQSVRLTAGVRQRGRLTDRVVVALLGERGEVSRQEVALSADRAVPVTFTIDRPEQGLHRYEIRAADVRGEVTTANNSAAVQLRVVKDPIRVLVLEGKPYWDGKFFVRTLSTDAAVEVDYLVRMTPQRFLKRSLRLTPPEPSGAKPEASSIERVETSEVVADAKSLLADARSLKANQVLVLGRDAEVFLTEDIVERIRQWISQDGGSLVCYRGSPVARPDQSLSRLLPVRWTPGRESRFRVQVTDRGQGLPWLSAPLPAADSPTLMQLPSLATATQAEGVKPLAVVLGRAGAAESSPAITYQPYGAGRVVAIEGSGMWRWAFLAPQYQSHEAVYATLWQSLLRWLVSSAGLIPGQDVALLMDRVSWTIGETASAVLLRRGETDRQEIGTVELAREGTGWKQSFTPVPAGDEPGVYQVYFGALEAGRYRGRLSATTESPATSIAFDVRPNLAEQLDVAARPDLMRTIAESSGGAVLNDSDSGRLGTQFREHLARTRPERVRRIPAWDRWWVLSAVLGLWGLAWGLRRSASLV